MVVSARPGQAVPRTQVPRNAGRGETCAKETIGPDDCLVSTIVPVPNCRHGTSSATAGASPKPDGPTGADGMGSYW